MNSNKKGIPFCLIGLKKFIVCLTQTINFLNYRAVGFFEISFSP